MLLRHLKLQDVLGQKNANLSMTVLDCHYHREETVY